MKKLNKEGFILVETLIVTVFVVSLFIFVYRITVPSIGEYEQQNYYDDIDSVYYSNLYKQMITRYANMEYIDEQVALNKYIDVSDCNNTNIYSNSNYCNLIKEKINIGDTGRVLLTDYDIKEFRNLVKDDDTFDSGSLTNFRSYLKTVSNHESFYSKISNTTNYVGKYRLFIIRVVTDSDGSTSRRYSNIGVYTGTNSKFLIGDLVSVDLGNGALEDFYVLRNSLSTDDYVTLIMAHNLVDSNVCFNNSKLSGKPTELLDMLKERTKDWINVPYLTNYVYESASGYSINYNGYHARLLEENDILDVLGCREDDKTCFDPTEAFEVEFDSPKLSFMFSGIDDNDTTNGYWTGIVLPDSDLYAWGLKRGYNTSTNKYIGTVSPIELTDCTNMQIRPVINIEKSKVVRKG